MLVHECIECQALSINRTAADDLSEAILMVYQDSLTSPERLSGPMSNNGIRPLSPKDEALLRLRLFGES